MNKPIRKYSRGKLQFEVFEITRKDGMVHFFYGSDPNDIERMPIDKFDNLYDI